MNIHSDPVVQHYDPVIICKVCKVQGHSKVSCPYTHAKDLANISHEDCIFWSFVQPEDKPSSLGGDALCGGEGAPLDSESSGSAEEESSESESDCGGESNNAESSF